MNYVIYLSENDISVEEVKAYLLNMKSKENSSLKHYHLERTKKKMFEVHLYINEFDIREIEDFISGFTSNWLIEYG